MAVDDAAIKRALGLVDAQRVAQLTLDLVKIKSYTGETVEVAEFYARTLKDLGLEVQLLRDFPRTPQVVARLRGTGGGPTLELNGHLDTIPVEHSAPKIADGCVWGRGATDMKGGLATVVEAVRCMVEAGVRLKGDLLLTAHGLHEAPLGHGEDITARMRTGPKGDAAIIAEGGGPTLPMAGLGMGIFEFRPFWRAALLTAATQKRLVLASHADSAWDEVRFVAGSTDQFVFERYDTEGGSRTVAVDIKDSAGNPFHMTRNNYARVFFRWLDAAGWRDRPPYEAMIGYAIYNATDESFVSYYEETAVWVAPSSAVEDEVSMSGLDGWLRWVEVKHNPLTGHEAVWRR